jgi:hypothetical protein
VDVEYRQTDVLACSRFKKIFSFRNKRDYFHIRLIPSRPDKPESYRVCKNFFFMEKLMVSNILELFSGGPSQSMVGAVSKMLGESESGVQSAVSSLMPAMLGSMMQKSSTTQGASDLFKMVTGANVDPGMLSNVAGMLGGGASTDKLLSTGTSLVSGLFGGDKVSGLASALSSVAGIKAGSASSLISIAAPFLFGMIKKLVSERGLDSTGMANLLLGQKATLAKANVDPRLTSALGFSSFSNMLDRVPASLAAVAPVAAPAVAKVVPVAETSSGLMKWLPWLAALIGAYLLWQVFSPKAPPPAPVAPPVVTAPAPVAAVALPASVYFELAKFDIGAEGSKTINAVVSQVTKDGKYSLTGYTDKTGDPAQNEELAKNRAKAVKDAMVAAGVPEANITLQPPQFLTGSYEDRAARRVDINKAN